MGSKTSEDHESQGGGHQSDSQKPFSVGGMPRGKHTSTDGDGSLGDNGGGADDDDDDASSDAAGHSSLTNPENVEGSIAATDNKRKRKKPKKKKKGKGLKQTNPPRVKLSDLFPSGDYPKGELQEYDRHSVSANGDGNLERITGAEKRYNERNRSRDDAFLRDYRKGAEVHRQVRRWVQETAKPGQTLMEIAVGIEDCVRALLGHDGLEPGDSLKGGMGFPTGLALNHCVAHYTPNAGQKDIVLQHQDVMKVDFGVHVNGWIVDSAFTMSFDPTYDNLLAAVKESTNAGIRAAGADVRICDVSASIQEVMESYEVEIRGKTYPVKPVRGICAHDIKHYHIHGGKSIPFVKNSDQTKMEEGEIFAIETFGTTGRARLRDGDGVYGYGLEYDGPVDVSFPLNSAKRLYKTIKENFGTLVFCRRYLDRLGLEKYLVGMNYLVSNGIVESYPPLMDIPGSYSAQFEHTVLLQETGKEVISRGDDY